MIKDLLALGLEGSFCNSDTNTVVFPEPVGIDTPIRDIPLFRALRQASTQCS